MSRLHISIVNVRYQFTSRRTFRFCLPGYEICLYMFWFDHLVWKLPNLNIVGPGRVPGLWFAREQEDVGCRACDQTPLLAHISDWFL